MQNLVFLPGLDGTAELFKFIKPFFKDFNCMFLKYPANSGFNYFDYVSFVKKQIEFEKYHVIAESFSGPIAIELCRVDKERVQSMSLVASFAKAPKPKILLKIGSKLSKIKLPKIICDNILLNKSSSEVKKECFEVIKKISSIDLSCRLDNMTSFRIDNNLNSVPVLYIQAANDLLVGKDSLSYIKNKIENLSVVKIDGPHLLLQSNPKRSSEVILNFLNEL